MQVIRNSIFGAGITMRRFKDTQDNTMEDDILDANNVVCDKSTHFCIENCLQQALLWIMVVGVVPIVIPKYQTRDNEENTETAAAEQPKVSIPTPETVSISVETLVNGQLKFSAQLTTQNASHTIIADTDDEHEVLVWVSPTCKIDPSGNLNSIFSRIVKMKQNLAFIRQRALVSMYISSNPAVVSHTEEVTNTDAFGVQWKDNQMAKDIDSDTLMNGKDLEIELAANQCVNTLKAELHNINCGNHGAEGGLPENNSTIDQFTHECKLKHYFLPQGRKLVRQEMPRDFMDVLQREIDAVELKTRALFCIPAAALPATTLSSHTGSKSSQNTNTGATMECYTFNSMITNFKCVIEMFGNHLLQFSNSIQNINLTDDEESIDRMIVQLPGRIYMGTEETFTLNERGIITDSECISILRASIGLRPSTQCDMLQLPMDHRIKVAEIQQRHDMASDMSHRETARHLNEITGNMHSWYNRTYSDPKYRQSVQERNEAKRQKTK